MFIITITVLAALFFISNFNSRISALENKIKTLNTVQAPSAPVATSVAKEKATPVVVAKEIPEAPHQDDFAKNIARIGVAILVLGVLFFLNYIDNQGWIGPVFKYISGLAFAFALLVVAELIRHKNKSYVNLLRGASFVVFYLTLIIGLLVFKIVSLPLTLGLTALVLALSVIISLKENDMIPFNLGLFGAFFILLFMVQPAERIAVLSFAGLLNMAVLFISLKKNWISSSVIGFAFSWLIYALFTQGDPAKGVLFAFSTLFGVQYLTVFLAQDFKKMGNRNVVLLTALNTFAYVAAFYGIAAGTTLFAYIGYFVALLSVFHFFVYALLKTVHKEEVTFVTLTHFVIAVLLITLAIPMQFDGPYVTTMFFVEGVVLSLLSTLKDFKDKSIMYALGFGATVLGILHMLSFGNYKTVADSGVIFANQSYLIWLSVFALINVIAFVWYKTVDDSADFSFKDSIYKASFVFIVAGQILFVGLTANELRLFGEFRERAVYAQIEDARKIDYALQVEYQAPAYEAEYAQIKTISRQTTFTELVLFMLMTVIYFAVGLVSKKRAVRNMGIVTLAITTVLLVALTWELGPVYRIFTFVGFGIALLVISYLYISKNKKHDAVKALMLTLAFGIGASHIHAAAIDLKDWTTFANLKYPEVSIGTASADSSQELYVLPLDTDLISMSKTADLRDIRIVNKDNVEVPYVLVKSNTDSQNFDNEARDVAILENSRTRDGKKILLLDTKREGLLYNTIRLFTDSSSINFRKKARVYISDTFLSSSNTSWKEVEQKNVIYNYTDAENFSINKLDIVLSGVSSRYLKIELVDDVDFDRNIKVGNSLNVVSAQIKYAKGVDTGIGFTIGDYLRGSFAFGNSASYKDVEVLSISDTEGRTEVLFPGDTGIEELVLEVDSGTKNFKRAVVVQGSNDGTSWSMLKTASIYRIDSPTYKGESLKIEMPPSTYKKIKVIVQNNNDKALDILKTGKIRLQNAALIISLDAGVDVGSLRVVTGNGSAPLPVYDMQKTIDYFEKNTPKIIGRGELIKNPEYKPDQRLIPFAERNKVFLNIGLLAVVLLLGVVGFFWMKNKHE